MDVSTLRQIAANRRADALTMIYRAKGGYTGGTLSSLDILTCLFYDVLRINPQAPGDPVRDRFVLSKGHSVEGYWAILADLGFFPMRELQTYSRSGSRLIGHPSNKVPGVEMCSDALGHGLPAGVGMALGAKRQDASYNTYVFMGDGELAEGSVWEAAMAAANFKLDNLFAVIDRNGLQISGSTEDVMRLEDLAAKWQAFGWEVTEIDGHDIPAILSYFHGQHKEGKPHCLIAHTRKGKGVSFIENRKEWHHKVPDDMQLQQAYQELGVEGVDWID